MSCFGIEELKGLLALFKVDAHKAFESDGDAISSVYGACETGVHQKF